MLSQKAFAVFCDEVVRNAGDKNEKLKAENASLTDAYKLLTSFKLTAGGDLMKEVNILEDEHTEDESNLFYCFEQPFNVAFVEVFRILKGTIAGVVCNPEFYFRIPELSVDHENEVLEMEYFVSKTISAKGFIKNYSGRMEDIVSLVGCNYHLLSSLNLENTLLSIHTIKIPKDATQHIMNLLAHAENYANEQDLRNELRTLCQVVPDRKDICSVEKHHTELLSKNSVLKVAPNLLQTLEVSIPAGSSVCWTLEEGKKGGSSYGLGSGRSLVFSPHQETAAIPLSSIANIQIKVSGIRLNRSGSPRRRSFIVTQQGIFYEYSSVMHMGFTFDGSLSGSVLASFPPGGLYRYISHVLATSNRNVTTNYQGPAPELTLRLRVVDLKTVAIGHHLETLGIDIDDEEED